MAASIPREVTPVQPHPRSYRPLIMGRRGAVAANHPLAAQAGLDVLRGGGNAVDAAVAVAFVLGVVEPMMSGVGGDGFYHVTLAGSGDGQARGICYNGTGAAPEAATVARYRAAGGIPLTGPLSPSIPGTVAGLAAMHRAHGRKSWSELAAPAIALARDGFAATHAYVHFASENRATLAADPDSRRVFLDGATGAAPAVGRVIVQTALARTLEEIAADPDTLYRGALARRMAAGCAARGVPLSERDLASCQAEVVAPIAIRYRGFEVRQTPPNSTGFVLLQELKIVERFDLAAMAPLSPELLHVLIEARKRAFLDRERWGTDPRFGAVPLDRLLSDAYADECAAAIDRYRAAPPVPPVARAASGDTTYYCVVDEAGNAVSAIQSINSAFGSGVTAGDTGILLNNRMAYWHLEDGHANQLVPGKRVRHTMNAPVVLKDGRPWCVLGTPGADMQVQVNLQVLVAMIEHGYDPQQALEMPRWSCMQPGQAANYPHTGEDVVTLEDRIPAETAAALRARGHRVTVVGALEGPCSVEAIRILENGVRMAGSDPRRDGWAAAY